MFAIGGGIEGRISLINGKGSIYGTGIFEKSYHISKISAVNRVMVLPNRAGKMDLSENKSCF